MKKTRIIPIFIPHYGCKNECVFCNQRKITNCENGIDINEIDATILAACQSADKSHLEITEIAFFGGSFTGLDLELMDTLLALGKKYVDRFSLRGIRISTRPDYISEEILEKLKNNKVVAIEIGVQSLDDRVLLRSKRGHMAEDVDRAAKLIKEAGFVFGVQLMVGLPGDSREIVIKSCARAIEYEPDMVRIYPVIVLKNTELEAMYLRGEYKPLELEEAVDICSELVPMFEKKQINIIRLGLHGSAEFVEGDGIVAGPWSEVFGQLVYDRINYKFFYELVDAYIHDNEVKSDDIIYILGQVKDVSRLKGYKGQVTENLKKDFNLKDIKVITKLKEQKHVIKLI